MSDTANQITIHAAEVATKVSSLSAKAGGASAFFGGIAAWLTENYQLIAAIGVIVGILVGVIGLIVNIYFQNKRTELMIKQKEDDNNKNAP